MSAVGTAQAGRRHPTSGRRRLIPASESALTIGLTRLTDLLLCATLIAVTACFAGRTAIGQLVLVALSVGTALAWSLRQLWSESPQWRATHSLWLWVAGTLIALVQALPLSAAWLERISPEHGRLLTLWASDSLGLLPAWNTLSFDPASTLSGLATFLSYGLIFLVVVQRIQTLGDVERAFQVVSCLGIGLAVFALLQYFFSNGLFFWFYRHPTLDTSSLAQGSFTNRNHFAQFLAVAIGPTFWWLVRSVSPGQAEPASFGGARTPQRWMTVTCLAGGLAVMLLAGLLSLSRAGSAAMGVSLVLTLVLLTRRGHLPARLIPVVFGTLLATGLGIAATRYQTLSDRIDQIETDDRLMIWAANLRIAERFPWFGTGVGTHLAAHRLETNRQDDSVEFSHAESGYLQVASECGIAGLSVGLLMIAACLAWCGRAYRAEAGPQSTALAAGLIGSLSAHLLHALVDFFWYAPACMLVMAVLGACACRLSQQARRIAQSVPEPVRPRSRLTWGASICGLTALACWMFSVKLPGALAEPHLTAYLTLRYHGNADQSLDEDELRHLEQLKLREIFAAARAHPHDGRTQLMAAAGSLQLFALRQETSENPMSLDQLRDAAIASEFESQEALHAWLDAAVGANRKYLTAAQRFARRAVRNCPLEGLGYVYLSRLEFLRDPVSRLEEPLQQQALTVRPFDATVDFEIGKLLLLKGDFEAAMVRWKPAFRRSTDYRQEIAEAMAQHYSAPELIEQLDPDWRGLGVLLQSFQAAEREDELPFLRERYAEASIVEAQRQSGVAAEWAWLEAVRTFRAAEQPEAAIRTAEAALEDHSQSLPLHRLLAELLIAQGDFAGGSKHYQWAAAHAPDDAALKQLAASTLKESLRRQTAGREDRAGPFR